MVSFMKKKIIQSKNMANCPFLKQVFFLLLIAAGFFIYLVMAAHYAPSIFVSFSKKLQPLPVQQQPTENLHSKIKKTRGNLSLISSIRGKAFPNISDGGGGPRIVILWTTWRSGSSFLGQLLARAMTNTFYSTEPLHYWKVNILHKNDSGTTSALEYLHDLLRCHLSKQYQKQLDYMSRQIFYMNYNTLLSKRCQSKRLCNNGKFISNLCQSADMHMVKVLRLSLEWAWTLLKDDNLDLRIIYNVRDPRAVLLSRDRVGWCKTDTCKKPEVVCQLLKEDLKQAQILAQTFPGRFMFMQYEKFSQDPGANLVDLMDFIGFPVSEAQLKMIKTWSSDPDSLYSINKDSRTQSLRWRLKGTYSDVSRLQETCKEPLRSLSLQFFNSEQELRNLSIPLILKNNSTN